MPRLTKEQALDILNSRPLYNVDFRDAKDALTRLFRKEHEAQVREPFMWNGRYESLPEEVHALDWDHDWSLHRVPGLQKKVRACEADDPCLTAMVLFLNDWEDAAATLAAAKKDVIKGRKPSTTPRKTKERTLENTGTCPCCGKNVKMLGGRMVDHGFTLYHGFRNGNCFGVNRDPWELSPQGKIDFIAALRAHRDHVAAQPVKDDRERRGRDQMVRWINQDIDYHQNLVSKWEAQPLPGTK